MYIHQTDTWPHFNWDRSRIDPKLAAVNKATGYLEGILSSIGFYVKERAAVEAYTHDIVASSEIEGLLLNPDQVRSSIARRRPLKKTLELKARENRIFEHDSTFFTFRLNNRFSESCFYR